MQTITINGRELLVPEGCPDLYIARSGKLMLIVGSKWRTFPATKNLRVLRVAACVAARWFERLAKVTFKRHAMSGVSMLDAINRSPGAIQVDEYRAAARAWGELADELWGE